MLTVPQIELRDGLRQDGIWSLSIDHAISPTTTLIQAIKTSVSHFERLSILRNMSNEWLIRLNEWLYATILARWSILPFEKDILLAIWQVIQGAKRRIVEIPKSQVRIPSDQNVSQYKPERWRTEYISWGFTQVSRLMKKNHTTPLIPTIMNNPEQKTLPNKAITTENAWMIHDLLKGWESMERIMQLLENNASNAVLIEVANTNQMAWASRKDFQARVSIVLANRRKKIT